MRLDWFLPHSRVVKAGGGTPGGILRRVLKAVGISWLSSPVRRIVQVGFLILFLVLFFYVCWPYGAEPGAMLPGWVPIEVDAASGKVMLVHDRWPEQSISNDGRYYLFDESAGDDGRFGWFVVEEIVDDQLMMQPEGALDESKLENLAMSFGPWTLGEVDPDGWPDHHARDFAMREKVAAELILAIDPLVSISTAIAGKVWVWSLVWAGILLGVCLIIPRGFCGYVCPLGTLIDLFDWSIGKRVTKFQVSDNGWWVHIKYYLLAATLISALGGVLLTGFVAAIPVVTRGLQFILAPVQTGVMRGWHQVPPIGVGQWVSIGLFLLVFALGFMKPRFWCRYVCPSGAVFSVFNLLRISERKVEKSCINCNKCVEVCPFDAIKPDFTTRTSDCTLCQTCGGVCPTGSIKFVARNDRVELKVAGDPPTGDTVIGRRGFISAGVGAAAAVVGGVSGAVVTKSFGAGLKDGSKPLPVRPPGSVPEQAFLQLCIRCGECFKACPNNVLQPVGFEQGLEGLWTPKMVADWSGCEPSCNNCGQVCPTGAIRALPIEEKRTTRMGLAVVNEKTCLPLAGKEECQLCVDECTAAGYHAIEFMLVKAEVDEDGRPIEGTGFRAPVVLSNACVGCGLCQTRCHVINVKTKHLLEKSAIIVEAGEGKEDRLMG